MHSEDYFTQAFTSTLYFSVASSHLLRSLHSSGYSHTRKNRLVREKKCEVFNGLVTNLEAYCALSRRLCLCGEEDVQYNSTTSLAFHFNEPRKCICSKFSGCGEVTLSPCLERFSASLIPFNTPNTTSCTMKKMTEHIFVASQ